jgi:hypothetical protein
VFQGWHFMSHTPWAGIIVWFSMFLTAMVFYGRARLDPTVELHPDRMLNVTQATPLAAPAKP